MYVCIDSSARRPNHTEFEKTTESEQTTARLGAVREVSEERLRSVREASEARPGGVRGASGRRPRSVRELPERRPNCAPKAFVAKPGPRIKNIGDSARSCLIFSVRTVKLLSVFDDFRGGAFSAAGAMNFHGFAQPPRLCRKFKTATPVHKSRPRSDRKCAFYSSFELEKCVFTVPVQ